MGFLKGHHSSSGKKEPTSATAVEVIEDSESSQKGCASPENPPMYTFEENMLV